MAKKVAKVRLFSKAEMQRRLNEAQTVANITSDIEQIQLQINQALQDYNKRVDPLKKKLIELQAQLSNLNGAQQQATQQTTQPGQAQPAGQQPQGGAAASPGATV